MKAFTKQDGISQSMIRGIVGDSAPDAYVSAGRPEYAMVDAGEIKAWLEHTQVDRIKWREASAGKPEFVCADFSLLLWALLEQERVIAGIQLPLAVARVTVEPAPAAYDRAGNPIPQGRETSLTGHSFNAFISNEGELLFIEPQTDRISRLDEIKGWAIKEVVFL